MSFESDAKKVEIHEDNWDSIIAPSSVLALITTVSPSGTVNAAPYGSCVRVCHDPVYLAFTCSVGTDTYDNILAVGEFVVNLVSFAPALLEKVLQIGLPWVPEINELERVGLTEIPSTSVVPPRIKECYAHFEARLEWTHSWRHRMMVTGQVAAVSVDSSCIDENQEIIWDVARPAHYCGGRYIDKFVPAYEASRIHWDCRNLEERGTTNIDFRPAEGSANSLIGRASDWRDMLRSAPP